MRKRERAQVIVIVAILLMVLLLLLAVVIDGATMMLEKQRLERAAGSAGKAGLIPAADHMVTQVVAARTAAATLVGTPSGHTATPGPTPTGTPDTGDFYGWLDDDDRKTLVAPPMRTMVATHSVAYADRNGIGPSNLDVLQLEVDYPYQYQAGDHALKIRIFIRRKVDILFGSLWGMDKGEISGESQQSLPQR